jgi:2-dehydro-3-deoxygluconokinase
MMAKLVTLGEVMMRLQTKPGRRLRQSLPGDIEVTFNSAEANIASAFTLLGGNAAFVTALPDNAITDACLGNLASSGVDVSHVIRSTTGRFGIYFAEPGANRQPQNVIYDCDYSAISTEKPGIYQWTHIFKRTDWFHTTGSMPSLSKFAARNVLRALIAAKRIGLPVSLELNFRSKLWRWDPKTKPSDLARRIMGKILPFVDVLIATEEDVGNMLGIKDDGFGTNRSAVDTQKFSRLAKKVAQKFPNLKKIVFTLRENVSITHNNWGCMLYDTASGSAHFAPQTDGVYSPYRITDIVDRIGGGDSFCAALIYALLDDELKTDNDKIAAFAAAASCLCHSIYGDLNYSTKEEVLAMMNGSWSGRIVR